MRTKDGDRTGHLHIGVCDGVPLPRLARLLASLRQTTPHISVHVHEMSLVQKVYELRCGFLDAALAPESGYGKGIVSEAIWRDPLIAVMPSKHPLTQRKQVALVDVVLEPLVLCQRDTGLGHQCQIEQIIRTVTATPNITDTAATLSMLVALVIAGYGIGLATTAQLEAVSASELVLRPLSDVSKLVKTWLMMRAETPAEPLARFIEHARRPT
ncbi:LysR family substrate-binding domain-containing protein [Nitrobacter sp. 62-23]|uniref:LysR family substrate-binding domain-containing protein n=1 Tax=Nitrobacter sp. 62-23 TaxID=1895798 RepID=UPI0025E5E1E3|nr:LysR family substrate-binding domain-containing protein [Nitrobacter sp. 62-23]